MNQLDILQNWYEVQCNGDWEHNYGIQITTLDNPGWQLHIHLDETELATRNFDKVHIERHDQNWLCCWVGRGEAISGNIFHAYCGPRNLTEVLQIFNNWSQTKDQ